MREYLSSLVHGVSRTQIPKKHKDITDDLISLRVLKKDRNQLKFGREIRAGKLDVNKEGVGFLDPIGDHPGKDLVIESEHLAGAMKDDWVVAERIFRKKGRPAARVVYIAEKSTPFAVGYLSKRGKRFVLIEMKTEMEIPLSDSHKSLAKLPLETVLKIDNRTGEVIEVLGVMDDPAVDEKISLALYNKKESFTKKTENEARSYGDHVEKSMYPERVDLTHLPFVTIDPARAKDHDDAVYFDPEEFVIYVAIADVSEYVTTMSQLDKEAYERGFSIYLPHKSIPMLPRALSENICSLKEGQDRLAYVFKITLYKTKFTPKKEELFEAIINSRRFYTYDRVDEFLIQNKPAADAVDEEVLTCLLPLYKLTQKIRKNRMKNGYDFANDEVQLILDSNLNLQKTVTEPETPSHSLIEECMLLANQAAAKRFNDGLFRIHDEPTDQKVMTLLNDLASMGIIPEKDDTLHNIILSIQEQAKKKGIAEHVDRMIIRSQQQASYSSVNSGHFGLGFEHYTHFTSPIRRYSDLVVHRLLKAIEAGNHRLKSYILSDIHVVAEKISTLEREAAKVEWDYEDRKYARWAKEHIGETFEAVVTDTDRNPIAIIEDRIMGARVFLSEGEVEFLDKIRLQIIDANTATARITGRLIEIKREE